MRICINAEDGGRLTQYDSEVAPRVGEEVEWREGTTQSAGRVVRVRHCVYVTGMRSANKQRFVLAWVEVIEER